MIELKDVYKVYSQGSVKFEALKGVSLKIDEGDFVVITGQSGSGKSTLMALLGCLDVPTRGSVLIDGVNVGKLSSEGLSELRSEKLGFVFQQFNLIPTLTSLDNATLPMEIRGKSRVVAIKRATELLSSVGLSTKLANYPSQLSGGQMQRVAIARALVNEPEIILADEPTGNLDSKSGEEVVNILRSLNKQGKTIVLITHEVKLASKCDKHFVLSDGQVVKKVVKK